MAGHSKWANIQHRKKAQDAKRGKIFTKYIREITVAARTGGPDPNDNPRLRQAIDKALGGNMTKDTIERAIKRGAGEDGADSLEEIRYEGYGPGGVAIMVDCMTDNRNRTVSEVRHAFSKHGGNLGTDGSVAYMFNKKGQFAFEAGADEDAIMEAALEAGADDVVTNDDGSIQVTCAPDDFDAVNNALKAAGFDTENKEVTMLPENTVAITDEDQAAKFMRLIDTLDDLDDTQDVFSNADVPDDILAKLDAN